MSHRYGGNPQYLEDAKQCRRLLQTLLNQDLIVAPWIECAETLPENPENRKWFLDLCVREATTCDLAVQCGPTVTAGMQIEAAACLAKGIDVLSLTWWQLAEKPTANPDGIRGTREQSWVENVRHVIHEIGKKKSVNCPDRT